MDILSYNFFRYALIGIALISIGAAVVGTYIVCRRMVALAGGVTHACFGGLGIGYLAGINPLWPAMLFAVGASLGVERLTRTGAMRSDSAIAVVWAVGMAVGVVAVFLTPGYVPELTSFLFGNILTVSVLDLWLEGAFVAALLVVYALWGDRIVAYAFDPDFMRAGGMATGVLGIVTTVLVSVGIVLTIRLVGVMLLMSMMALPPLTAELFTHRYERVTMLAALIGLVTSYAALWVSTVVNVPVSAFIVLLQASAYGVCRAVMALRERRSAIS